MGGALKARYCYDPQPDPAGLQSRSIDLPCGRELLHRHLDFRVVSGRADPPLGRPRQLAARSDGPSSAHRSSIWAESRIPSGVWVPCLSYADGKFWLVYTNVKPFDGNFMSRSGPRGEKYRQTSGISTTTGTTFKSAAHGSAALSQNDTIRRNKASKRQ
jgi:hypothetical protein